MIPQTTLGKQGIQIDILKNGRLTSDKVGIAKALKRPGYVIQSACQALGVSRRRYYSQSDSRKKEGRFLESKINAGIIQALALPSARPFQ